MALKKTRLKKIDFKRIEKKWQGKWERQKVFEAHKNKKQKAYVLEMFPYPSGSTLHMGHAFNYTIGDICARFNRMKGFNVMHPIGFDSFGLPAENAAIKEKSHPRKFIDSAVKNYIDFMKKFGLSYSWERIIKTSDPSYYKWNQFFFLKFLERGLVYRKHAPVNFCKKCDTVLANEQVHNGTCWRHTDTPVEIKQLEQWFIKTTDYAEELLNDINDLEWPERIKTMQRHWIGKSHGTEILFEVHNPDIIPNFVLLHGYEGSPHANFFPRLKEELEKRNYKVDAPALPHTSRPDITEQIEHVLKNCVFNEHTVLLGHSLGSVIALKVIEQLKKPIKKLILAAGFLQPSRSDRPYAKTFDWTFDFKKIKKNVGEIIILCDKNDMTVSPDNVERLEENLGQKVRYVAAQEEHFCGKEEPEVLNTCLNRVPIFTTRPDTLYGVTYLVISAQHAQLDSFVSAKQKKAVHTFLKKINSTSEKEVFEKEGVFSGSYGIHPTTNEKIPLWIGNFVVADYGSGIVMAVPAHDQRDYEFATKYTIPITIVIQREEGDLPQASPLIQAYTGEGRLVNSGDFDGWNSKDAVNGISEYLEGRHLARKTTAYKLKDWLVSRQRYWGTPIPIVYCDTCGIVGLNEKDLPVLLPEKIQFGKGNPLTTNKKFLETICPRCKGKARRETDTMDTFFDSSWYFLRFTDPHNHIKPFDQTQVHYWMTVDQYIGGAEHACMHLIYARFFTKALRDLGFVSFSEPFKKLFNQGMLHGEDGFVMSKSRGNVIVPEEVSRTYGIDTARLFLMSVASPDKDISWSENGIEGSARFISKVYDYFTTLAKKSGKTSRRADSKLHKKIHDITEDIEQFHYNLAIIKLRELFEVFIEEPVNKNDAGLFLKLLHPFCPHITEELWEKLGNKSFITLASWPTYDHAKVDEELEKQDHIVTQVIADISSILKIIREKQNKEAKNIFLYVLPNEQQYYDSEKLSKKIGKSVRIFAVNDKIKYDPEMKSSKTKPGKPGIYVE